MSVLVTSVSVISAHNANVNLVKYDDKSLNPGLHHLCPVKWWLQNWVMSSHISSKTSMSQKKHSMTLARNQGLFQTINKGNKWNKLLVLKNFKNMCSPTKMPILKKKKKKVKKTSKTFHGAVSYLSHLRIGMNL